MQLPFCIVGFGNVARELVRLVKLKQLEITQTHGVDLRLVGVSTARHGVFMNRGGLDLDLALENWERLRRQATSLPDSIALIRESDADIMVELTPIDRRTGRPAIDHIEAALTAGLHVVTANKGPIAHDYRRLRDLAKRRQKAFLFEATVMDGFPIFNLFRECMPVTKVAGFRGVLNSTTNLILTKMEEGMSFDDAVRHAQDIGIAETDPSNDIDGWDSAVKLSALCNVMMDADVRPQQVERIGIRDIAIKTIQEAAARGRKIRLICSAELRGERVESRVAPEEVGADDPAYRLYGTAGMIQLHTDTLKTITLIESPPTPAHTAFGVLADMLSAARGRF